MRTVKIGFFNTVQLFDSIHELTKDREHQFYKWLMMDFGVGNTIESIDMHLKTLHLFVATDRKDEAIQEIMNMRLNYFYMIEKIDFSSLCFAVLVNKINKETIYKVHDFDSVHGISEQLKKIGVNSSHVSEVVSEVKKNLKRSFGLDSPNDIMQMIAYTG